MAALVVGCALALSAGAPAAVSPASISTNWAGYVVTGTSAGTRAPAGFSTVAATWVQPKADCRSTTTTGATASAFWIGLGGNANASNALEQAGTEADCGEDGTPHYFAWYELVPADSVALKLNVTPGDTISVSIGVRATHVTVRVRNLSQGTSFAERLTMAAPDTTSAEWIAEAPAMCSSVVNCQQQALTNFGRVTFTDASTASAGHGGPISDPAWSAGPIELQAGSGPGFGFGQRFAPEQSLFEALPSGLSKAGGSFSVSWRKVAAPQPRGGFGFHGDGGQGGGGDGLADGGLYGF